MSKFGFTSPSRSKTLVCCGLRVHQGGIRQDRIERTYSISEVQRTRRRLFVNPFCRAKPKRRIHQNFLSGDGIIVRTPELTAHNHRVGLHASAAMRCLTDSEQDLLSGIDFARKPATHMPISTTMTPNTPVAAGDLRIHLREISG